MDVRPLESLALLRCPLSKANLRYATAEELRPVNDWIAAASAIDQGGQRVTEPVVTGLIDENGLYVYPVRDNIMILVKERAIPCQQGNLEQ